MWTGVCANVRPNVSNLPLHLCVTSTNFYTQNNSVSRMVTVLISIPGWISKPKTLPYIRLSCFNICFIHRSIFICPRVSSKQQQDMDLCWLTAQAVTLMKNVAFPEWISTSAKFTQNNCQNTNNINKTAANSGPKGSDCRQTKIKESH